MATAVLVKNDFKGCQLLNLTHLFSFKSYPKHKHKIKYEIY